MLSAVAIIAAILVAVPAGLAIGHTGRGAFMTVSVANLGRSIPSYALLIIFVTWFGIGFAAAFPALVVLAIPPILTNTCVGLARSTATWSRPAAPWACARQLLRRSNCRSPRMIAGVRIAAVQVVATATLALVGGGALGRYIVDGFAAAPGHARRRRGPRRRPGAAHRAGVHVPRARARLARARANRTSRPRSSTCRTRGRAGPETTRILDGLLTGLCGLRC